jgi:hypothetical protein
MFESFEVRKVANGFILVVSTTDGETSDSSRLHQCYTGGTGENDCDKAQ